MPARLAHLTGPLTASAPLAPEALDEAQKQFRDSLCGFASQRLAPHRRALEALDYTLTRKLLDECAETGVCAIDIPGEHGGLELGWITAVAASDYLADGHSASFMVSLGAVTGIGLLPILLYGTEEQKARWLPPIADGRLKGAYALTEPGSGSDALAATTRAVPVDGGWQLDGRKQYISNAGFADYFIVFAQVRDPSGSGGLSAFLVPRNSAGLSVGTEENKMGLKGSSTAALALESVTVPTDHLLGLPGEGAAIALCTLDMGRLKLGFMNLGMCRYALVKALRYTEERRQFGIAIAGFEAIQAKLAAMGSGLFGLECLAWRVLGMLDTALGPEDHRATGRDAAAALENLALETSMVKILGSETLFRVADHALQCLGGYGFIEDYGLAAIVRDTRVDRIFEGTNEINRQVIVGNLLKAALEGALDLSPRDSQDRFLPGDPPVLGPALALLAVLRDTFRCLLDAAIAAWGQDLALHQQAGEDLADLAIRVTTLESACLRVRHWHEGFNDRHCVFQALELLAWESRAEALRCGQRLRAGMGEAGSTADAALATLAGLRGAATDPYEAARALAASLRHHGRWPEGR